MMRNKISNDKRANSESNESHLNEDQNEMHQVKQQKPSINNKTTISETLNTSISCPNKNSGHYFYNNANYPIENQNTQTEEDEKLLMTLATPTSLSNSWKNAFQMSSINMPSLPDYFSQLPSVSMPSMPNISIPTLPSIPLTMPSMPNLSMPNISMPNINFPSISDFMPFYLGKNIKSWDQICTSVRESRKKFTSVCPTLPFNFNFCYDLHNKKLRFYFLASINSFETTLYYCDVMLLKELSNNDNINERTEIAIECLENLLNYHQKILMDENCEEKFKDSGNQSKLNSNFDITDCDIENNISSNSSRSMSISSSNSNDSYIQTSINPLLLRKSITSPISSLPNFDTLEWKQLIKLSQVNFDLIDEVNVNAESSNNKKISDFSCKSSLQEEDLILQRKRILINGVSSYDFHPKMARFVFTMKNAIYWFDDIEMIANPEDGFQNENSSDLYQENISYSKDFKLIDYFPPYVPKKLMTNDLIKVNATICPGNPDLVAYTADCDLWVCDLISGCELRLTNTDYSKTSIMAGKPSFVMQEEFSRFIGFWWRPSDEDHLNNYTLLCEFVDESFVESISIPNLDGTNETHRFPKAGTLNAKSTLKLVHFSYNSTSTDDAKLCFEKIEDLRVKLELLFPEYEYLIRCDWLSDDVIWAQLLNRKQNRLVIVLISILERFPAQIIYEESQEEHWYNCHEIFYFYKNKSNKNNEINPNCDYNNIITVGSKVEFLWSSEISGFRHLYKIIIEIVDHCSNTPTMQNQMYSGNPNPLSDFNNDHHHNDENSVKNTLYAKILENRQLTNGNWEISDSMIWIDEENDLIYFVGSKDSPLEEHLYVVSSSQYPRISPRRLSKEDFTHTSIVFDPKFKFCIDFQSNLTMPPLGYLYQIVYPEDTPLNITLEPLHMFLNLPDDIKVEDSLEYYEKVQNLGPTPQLFEYKLKSGELIYGFLFKPEYMEPGLKYPVLLEIYGGPEVQVVTKSFKDLRQHRRHLIASEGYIVVGFDSRGSKHRGVEFEKHIYKRLGQVELNDQVEALEWLAENTGFIDMNRVAIHGWSYGGYLSLMALAKRPDIFKCAVAGAPVTNWFLYDTGYTERYLGLPSENEECYRRSNVLSYIKNFPNEYNRLLIIHGLMDDNVHFCHTAQLIQGLVMLGKPYSLNVYPYERHSLKKMHSSEHYEATLIYYLQQNL